MCDLFAWLDMGAAYQWAGRKLFNQEGSDGQ